MQEPALLQREMPPCDLPDDELLAYLDGELRGARKEWVEAHRAVCSSCQQRLADFAAVDCLLREGTPLVDDPAGRATLRARAEEEFARRARSRWWRLRRRLHRFHPRWPQGLVTALGLKATLLALIFWPGFHWAGWTVRALLGGIVLATATVVVSALPRHPRRAPHAETSAPLAPASHEERRRMR